MSMIDNVIGAFDAPSLSRLVVPSFGGFRVPAPVRVDRFWRGRRPKIFTFFFHVIFGPMPSSIEHVRAGTLRALAVTTVTRSEALPDIPTLSEFLPGYEASQWYGIGIPKS